MTAKNKYTLTEKDVILNSLGLTDKKSRKVFKSAIIAAGKSDRKLIRSYNNLLSLISMSVLSGKILTPDPLIKDRVFKNLNLKNKKEAISGSVKKRKNFEFILTGANEWMPHPKLKGIEIKPLSLNNEKGYLMLLMKASAGSEYPPHHHNGAEECYVLDGDVLVEGKTLGPGDFHHAERGSNHKSLSTKNGCTLLLVVDPLDS